MVNLKAWFAEGVSTFALVFFGTIAVTLSVAAFGSGMSIEAILLISFAHGSAIALMVYAFGSISGAHINPAVTIPMMITRKIDVPNGIGYIIFQILGATVAAFMHKFLIPLGEQVKYGVQTGPSELIGSSAMAGLGVEAILTFFLLTVIFMTAVYKKASPAISGISIGGMIFLIHLVGIALTGASVNPARTFGPALASGFWEFHWIYWVGPIVGGIIAAVIMNYLFIDEKKRRR